MGRMWGIGCLAKFIRQKADAAGRSLPGFDDGVVDIVFDVLDGRLKTEEDRHGVGKMVGKGARVPADDGGVRAPEGRPGLDRSAGER